MTESSPETLWGNINMNDKQFPIASKSKLRVHAPDSELGFSVKKMSCPGQVVPPRGQRIYKPYIIYFQSISNLLAPGSNRQIKLHLMAIGLIGTSDQIGQFENKHLRDEIDCLKLFV